MAERNNIWGRPNCELPNGKLCNACCILPEIELEGFYTSVAKPRNSPCPHLVDESGETGGCKLHPGRKPQNCASWHCSNLNLNQKMEYIAQGLSTGLVREDEAIDAAKMLYKGRKDLDDIVRHMVIDTSKRLSLITKKRELIYGDLDEP